MEKYTYYIMQVIQRIMKFSFYMILLTVFGTQILLAKNANGQLLSQATINITIKNKSLKEILTFIEVNSSFKFTYNESLIQPYKNITINKKDEPLTSVLKIVLANTNLDYIEHNDQVVIVEKQLSNPGLSPTKRSSTSIPIKGKVTDESGVPIPGATIKVKGSNIAAATNSNGEYIINVPDGNSILIFSSLGFDSKEEQVGARNVINAKLTANQNSLSDVVVVGYGTQTKATVTGSIASVTSKEINTSTSMNVVNNLAGKLPGLRVTQRSGEPGDYATDFDIRGFGTPLIIVDGIPRETFNRLDPNEIESISVLKDASAAVYGVKGGNGVILVTTKRGATGKTEFNYSATIGRTQTANNPKILNSYEFATLTNEAYLNAGNNPPYTPTQLDQYKSGALPSTDWYSLVTNNSSPQQQHSISATGSSDKIRYYLSAGYYGETGIYKSGDLNANRYNFRSNITADLSKDLQAEFLINGIREAKNAPGETTASIFQTLWSQPPNITPYANNNPLFLNNMADAAHPLAITDASQSGYSKNVIKTLNGSLALNYKIPGIDGLKARVVYAYDDKSTLIKAFTKQVNLYTYNPVTDTYPVTGSRNSPTSYTERYINNVSTTAQASLDYTKTFLSDHNIKALLLVEQRKQNGDDFQGYRQFSFDAVDQLYAGNTLNQSTTSTQIIPNVNQSVVGRLNYDYKGKYLLEGSFREDGSSKFAEGHRWGFFPGISAGWRISEEGFMKNKFKALDNLKIRASYSKTGDDGSSTYQYLSGYNYPGANYVFGNDLVNGLGFRGLANENLTWYTARTANIGVDADFWQGKLSVVVEVFSRKREGLLATRNLTLPGTVGAALPQENLNSDYTQGMEIALSHRNQIGKVTYNISGNISFTRTKNLYIERASSNNSERNWRDNNSNRWNDNYFGYHVIGQYQSMEEIKNSPITDGNGNRGVLPGDLKYEDVNKDGIIDEHDMKNVGRNTLNTPQISFGTSLSVQYAGFDINVLLQGATNFTVSYLGTIALNSPLAFGRNGLDVFMDRWHHEDLFDVNSPWIPGKYPSTRIKGGTSTVAPWNERPSDYWLKDASYLRLKSIQFGYSLPKKLFANGKYIKGLRIFASGYNLVTWSGLNSLVDPEHPNSNYGNYYPITKNYDFGVNLTF